MALIVVLLLVLALALFLAASFGAPVKVNLLALGLASLTAAFLLPAIQSVH